MSERTGPRWLNATAAAAYVSMTEPAFRRRVSLGIFPKPNLSAGAQSPRWDRLALDAAFDAGADSTDTRLAFQGLANEIAAQGKKGRQGRQGRQAHARGRHGQGISLRPAQARGQSAEGA